MTVYGLFGLFFGVIYALNCVVMCMRLEMAMDFGFTK